MEALVKSFPCRIEAGHQVLDQPGIYTGPEFLSTRGRIWGGNGDSPIGLLLLSRQSIKLHGENI